MLRLARRWTENWQPYKHVGHKYFRYVPPRFLRKLKKGAYYTGFPNFSTYKHQCHAHEVHTLSAPHGTLIFPTWWGGGELSRSPFCLGPGGRSDIRKNRSNAHQRSISMCRRVATNFWLEDRALACPLVSATPRASCHSEGLLC